MYSALDLAKYIVTMCVDENHPISNLQLQKILFYIQKDFLGRDCIAFEEDIEAWTFGPVVPEVYYFYCGNGADQITFPKYDIQPLKAKDKNYVDAIVREKRMQNPWKLVDDTHKQGGAWSRIYNKGAGNKKIIPIEYIKKFG